MNANSKKKQNNNGNKRKNSNYKKRNDPDNRKYFNNENPPLKKTEDPFQAFFPNKKTAEKQNNNVDNTFNNNESRNKIKKNRDKFEDLFDAIIDNNKNDNDNNCIPSKSNNQEPIHQNSFSNKQDLYDKKYSNNLENFEEQNVHNNFPKLNDENNIYAVKINNNQSSNNNIINNLNNDKVQKESTFKDHFFNSHKNPIAIKNQENSQNNYEANSFLMRQKLPNEPVKIHNINEKSDQKNDLKSEIEKLKEEVIRLKNDKINSDKIINNLNIRIKNIQETNKDQYHAAVKKLNAIVEKQKEEIEKLKNDKYQSEQEIKNLRLKLDAFKSSISTRIKNSLNEHQRFIEENKKISSEKFLSYLNDLKSLENLKGEFKFIEEQTPYAEFFLCEDLYCGSEKRCIEDFSCLICLNIVMDPLQCGKCDKLFCNDCIKNHLDMYDFCPNCRDAPFSRTNFSRLLKKILDESEFKCPMKCNKIFPYSDLERHKNECEKIKNKNLICEYCCKNVKGETEEEHKEKCEFLKMNCVYCKKQFYKLEFKEHYGKCESKEKYCDEGKIYYPNKFAEAHESFYKEIIKVNQKFFDQINKLKFKIEKFQLK